ncbi:hypothetical protein BHM03_00031158 [Ensete ventricosum]|nr:hypothetical protein BHM03_00031158 [Ensete ventricosum]
MDKMETAVSYVERKHLTLLDRRVSTRILSLYPRAGINKIATQTQEHRKKKKRRGIESYEIGKRTEGAYQNAKANRFDLDDELSVSLRIKSPTWGRTFRYSSPFNPLESGSGRLWVRIRIPESGSDYPLPNGGPTPPALLPPISRQVCSGDDYKRVNLIGSSESPCHAMWQYLGWRHHWVLPGTPGIPSNANAGPTLTEEPTYEKLGPVSEDSHMIAGLERFHLKVHLGEDSHHFKAEVIGQ